MCVCVSLFPLSLMHSPCMAKQEITKILLLRIQKKTKGCLYRQSELYRTKSGDDNRILHCLFVLLKQTAHSWSCLKEGNLSIKYLFNSVTALYRPSSVLMLPEILLCQPTPSVLVADVWKAPHVPQVHGVPDDREQEVHLFAPGLSRWIQTRLLDHQSPERSGRAPPVRPGTCAFPRALWGRARVTVGDLPGPRDRLLFLLRNAVRNQPAVLLRLLFFLLLLVVSIHHHWLFHLHAEDGC